MAFRRPRILPTRFTSLLSEKTSHVQNSVRRETLPKQSGKGAVPASRYGRSPAMNPGLVEILGRKQGDEFAAVQLPLVERLVRTEHGNRGWGHAQIQQIEQCRIGFGAGNPLACD